MKKILVAGLALFGAVATTFGNGLEWTCGQNWCCYSNGAPNYLKGSTLSSVGCLAQLLWVGPNGVIDPAQNSGDGATGDDLVIDKNFMGNGVGGVDGYFNVNQLTEGGNIVSGRVYYIRLWSAPASDFASGLVPTSPTNKYANSYLWTYPSSNPTFDTFDGTATENLNTTLSPIPEPAMIFLGLAGLISLRVFRRRK